MIDTHCHLDFSEFDQDRKEVLARYCATGGNWLILSVTEPATTKSALALCQAHDQLRCLAGIHPSCADTCTDEGIEILRACVDSGLVVGIGETGLDFYRNVFPVDVQEQTFRCMLNLAQETGLPLVLHVREAHEETLDILRKEGSSYCGVAHSFTGEPEHARAYMKLGFFIAFNGIVTFPKADNVREALAAVPLDRLLVETDAPYLAPKSVRGKRNEPAYLKEIIDFIAKEKGVSPEEVESITEANARQVFGLCN